MLTDYRILLLLQYGHHPNAGALIVATRRCFHRLTRTYWPDYRCGDISKVNSLAHFEDGLAPR